MVPEPCWLEGCLLHPQGFSFASSSEAPACLSSPRRLLSDQLCGWRQMGGAGHEGRAPALLGLSHLLIGSYSIHLLTSAFKSPSVPGPRNNSSDTEICTQASNLKQIRETPEFLGTETAAPSHSCNIIWKILTSTCCRLQLLICKMGPQFFQASLEAAGELLAEREEWSQSSQNVLCSVSLTKMCSCSHAGAPASPDLWTSCIFVFKLMMDKS